MLHVFPSSPDLLRVAKECGQAHRASAMVYTGLPTDGLKTLLRGYKTMGIMATEPAGLPADWNWHTDTLPNVDFRVVNRASEFVHAIVRELDKTAPALRET